MEEEKYKHFSVEFLKELIKKQRILEKYNEMKKKFSENIEMNLDLSGNEKKDLKNKWASAKFSDEQYFEALMNYRKLDNLLKFPDKLRKNIKNKKAPSKEMEINCGGSLDFELNKNRTYLFVAKIGEIKLTLRKKK